MVDGSRSRRRMRMEFRSLMSAAAVPSPALLRVRHSILQTASSNCPTTLCPFYNTSEGPMQVYLRQVRGLFSAPFATSNESYLSSYVNDSWAVNRRMTINAGLRWEEEQLNGPNQQYVFIDNWSPRLGINIDPFADRKTKVYLQLGAVHPGSPYRRGNSRVEPGTGYNRRPLGGTLRWQEPALHKSGRYDHSDS